MGKISKETKVAYIEQILLKKMTALQVAKELKVDDSTVYAWVKKFKENPNDAFPGSGKQTPEDAEMRKLTNEVKQLKAEIEFLKKVSAYFAKDHGRSTPI